MAVTCPVFYTGGREGRGRPLYTRRQALRPASTMWASKWPHVRCWWELEHSKPAEFRALGPGVAMAIAKRPAWLVDNPRPWGSRPSAFAWRPMLACAHFKVVAACAQPQRLQHPERGVELARTFDHIPLVVLESHRIVAILPRLPVQVHLCPLDLVRFEDSRAHGVAASPSAQRGHRCGRREAANTRLWFTCNWPL